MEKITPVTFPVTKEKGIELKTVVHVNRMKQFYSPLEKPYNDTSPTLEHDVKYLIDESELLSDEGNKMEAIESDTDSNSMAEKEMLHKRFLINIQKLWNPKIQMTSNLVLLKESTTTRY